MGRHGKSDVSLPRQWWAWLVVQLVVVTWDYCYVLLRPHSLPGGSLAPLFSPYVKYAQMDLVYGTYHPFGIAQSWMNVAENLTYLAGLLLHQYYHDHNRAALVWFGALAATFSKVDTNFFFFVCFV